MELNLSDQIKQFILALLLIILPLLILLIGIIYSVSNNTVFNVWFYVGVITWFGTGIIFYLSIE